MSEISGVEAAPGQAAVPKDAKIVRGHPLVGSLVDMLRDGPGFVTRLAREHRGEIVGFRLGPITLYLVTHPDHVQHVLLDQSRSYGKGGMWECTKPLLGNGLLTSTGAFWLRQRRLMQPLFKPGHLATLVDQMADVADREVTGLVARGSATVDMEREMGAMTQQVILQTMFGQSMDRGEMVRLGTEIQIALKGMSRRLFLYFLPERFPLPGERRYRAAIAAVDEAMLRLARARHANGTDGTNGADGIDRSDLLTILLRARSEETGEAMDERQLRDEVVTLFAAGQDSTAALMTWLWYALEQNPEVERRLHAEVADVLGSRRPTFDDLARLEYTKRVLQEALRLYPPAWMFPRTTAEEAIIGGRRIPAGSTLLLSAFASHRAPAFWPDPETFDPERFTPERSAGRPRYAYYPFGGGPRQCIGNYFAMMTAQIITAMMVQRLRPRLVPGHRVVPTGKGSLYPRHGMKMTLGAAARR